MRDYMYINNLKIVSEIFYNLMKPFAIVFAVYHTTKLKHNSFTYFGIVLMLNQSTWFIGMIIYIVSI